MRIAPALLALAACGSAPDARDTPDAPVLPDAQSDAPAADTQRVFAHSGDMLYALDRATLDATAIGPITGIGTLALLDLAIDKDDHFIGITRDTLYRIEPATGAATRLQDLPPAVRGFTSLTYAPRDVGDPLSPDILVGVNDRGQVFRIDTTATATATATVIGNFGQSPDGDPIGSSGDLIAVRGFGIFATVNLDVGMENYEDHLAQIDPVTWKATVLGQSGTGFDQIFGLGFWNGKLYGFVDDGVEAGTGSLIELDPRTGGGQLISKSPTRWFGAGVATDAPI